MLLRTAQICGHFFSFFYCHLESFNGLKCIDNVAKQAKTHKNTCQQNVLVILLLFGSFFGNLILHFNTIIIKILKQFIS